MTRNGKKQKGFTVIELIIVLGIFSVVMAALYSAYSVQMRQGVKEFHTAESEMELQIARTIIERDIAMAGYGLVKANPADPEVSTAYEMRPLEGSIQGAANLTLRGIAVGRSVRTTASWSAVNSPTPATASDFWSIADPTVDTRENLRPGDWIVYLNPLTSELLLDSTGTSYLFPFPNPTLASGQYPVLSPQSPQNIVYGLSTSSASTNPYHVVTYSLGGTPPAFCAPGAKNLLRSEDGSAQPVLDCALDLEVAFGVDYLQNGTLGCWDNGGSTYVNAAPYASQSWDIMTLESQLKQTKFYVLVQEGSRDDNYTYSNPDPLYSSMPSKIRVGDLKLTACGGGGVGNDVTISGDQVHYRWRVLSVTVTARNISPD